jgi:hypothetical protein
MQVFARYWDLFANSGRFPRSVTLIIGSNPFHNFMGFSEWLFGQTSATHGLAIERLWRLLDNYLIEQRGMPVARVRRAMALDYLDSGAIGVPVYLKGYCDPR